MKHIAILTSLSDLSSAYSVAASVFDQYTVLKEYGNEEFKVNVYCNEHFNEMHKKTLGEEWHFNLPSLECHRYNLDEYPNKDFKDQVTLFEYAYTEIAEKSDIIITHDLMFLDTHLSQNQAIRNVIKKLNNKLWIHWIHSGPSGRPSDTVKLTYPSELRYTSADESKYVFLNYSFQQDFANMLLTNTSSIHVVHNFRDIASIYGFGNDTREFINKYDILSHDILQIYPFSSPRWISKGVNKLIKIFSYWKSMDQNVKLVLVNSHANGESKKDITALKSLIKMNNLELNKDVILTSDFKESWEYSVPRRFIAELNLVSNLFIFPSISEGCSLIQAEASIAGKFIVLNKDCPSMLEFADSSVLSYKFTINSPDVNPDYYWAVANEILAEMKHEKTFRNSTLARTKIYNTKWIWENQFRPLLYMPTPQLSEREENLDMGGYGKQSI